MSLSWASWRTLQLFNNPVSRAADLMRTENSCQGQSHLRCNSRRPSSRWLRRKVNLTAPGLLGKTLMMGKTEGKSRRGRQRTRWLDGITDSVDLSLSTLPETGKGRNRECCSPRRRRDSDMTWRLNNIDNNWLKALKLQGQTWAGLVRSRASNKCQGACGPLCFSLLASLPLSLLMVAR